MASSESNASSICRKCGEEADLACSGCKDALVSQKKPRCARALCAFRCQNVSNVVSLFACPKSTVTLNAKDGTGERVDIELCVKVLLRIERFISFFASCFNGNGSG